MTAEALPAPAAAPKRGKSPSLLKRIAKRVLSAQSAILALLLFMVGVQASDIEAIDVLRQRVFDSYHRFSPADLNAALKAKNLPPRMAMVVDIDEESLAEIGQWPWPRSTVARLLQQINRYQPFAVGFDIVFADPDRMSPPRLAESFSVLDDKAVESLRGLPDTDAVFAQVLKTSRAVLGQAATPNKVPVQESAVRTAVAELGGNPRPKLLNFEGVVRNIPPLDQAASGRGLFSVNPEVDGIVRRLPAAVASDGHLYVTLGVEMLRVALGQSAVGLRSNPTGIESIFVQGLPAIPTDINGRILLHFAQHDPARYVSARDVMAGKVPPDVLGRRFVLIGTSAEGLKDIRATPVDRAIPGVEIHAMMIEQALGGGFLTRPWYLLTGEWVALLISGLLIIFLLPLIGARWTVLMFGVIVAGLCATSWYLFVGHKMLFDAAYPVIAALLIYTLVTYANYAKEQAEREQVRGAFARYLSPALVEQLAQDPDRLKLGGEMREMTLMFSDVRGFTTISEQYKTDPEGLTRLINRFLEPCTNLILSHKGTIDKYMGDAIMAFWNAPVDVKDHTAAACRSALGMFKAMDTLNAELEAEAKATGRKFNALKIGVGINTGICCVGNMGSSQRFDYSVLGDTVNLASRLEGQSKTYGVLTVLGEAAQVKVPGFACLELDLIAVKGKKEAVRIFTMLGDETVAATPEFRAMREKHDRILAAYRAQQWDACEALMAENRPALEKFEIGGLYDLYAERIAEFRANPPPANWDGVYVATSK
ncbi:MAG: adenylate/guanylate cyclase domain-containing protein [Alphaproteobacteria bacterium]|nr:adenylate/guanylate cyclase domain-containing protein [Alphaproteobacteria bacterium]